MARTALLILDMQNDLVDPNGKIGAEGFARIVEQRGLIPRISKVLAQMRSRKLPVAFVRVGSGLITRTRSASQRDWID